jgi:uncharacterized iron-regulated membrane protein
MSDREKKLIFFFALAGFAVLNFTAFNYAKAKRVEVNNRRAQAEQQLAIAETAIEKRDEVADEMEWLAEHEPEPKANQDVQTSLQQLAEREAKSTGLTIKSQKFLPSETTGKYYHRAKLQFVVTGSEQALYQWFDRLNVPDQFRVASQINLKPNQQDDTKIDCTATVEQWFVPAT